MIIAMKKLVLGLPVVAGVTVGLVAPASAVTFSTSGSTIEFCSNGINTFAGEGCDDDLGTILSGNSATPGGNVELGGNVTDGASLRQFLGSTTPASSLTADFGEGETITFSSLTASDWFGVEGGGIDTSYGAKNFANQWFAEAFANLAASGSQLTAFGEVAGFNAFMTGVIPRVGSFGTLFGRFSDPNISYVNDNGGEYTFGLAGHKDAGQMLPLLAGLSASEVVKVTYGGESWFEYSFDAPTDSGQVAADDGKSHNGNFEFAIAKPSSGGGVLSESVPEPASILGLVAVSGLVAARKRMQH